MKITLQFLILIIFISCKSEIKKENFIKSKNIDTIKTIVEKPIKELKNTYLTELLSKGLIIADSIENCNNYKFEFEPRLKLEFNFDNNQKLILAEIGEGIIDNELELLDFSIYDCKKDSILLESLYTIADYKIVEIKPELVFEISAWVPNPNHNNKTLFSRKIFKEFNGSIITENKILYKPIPLTQERKDEISNLIQENKEDYIDQFEKIISDLFIASINGDEKLKKIFFELKNNKHIDGGVAELYYDYLWLLRQVEIK